MEDFARRGSWVGWSEGFGICEGIGQHGKVEVGKVESGGVGGFGCGFGDGDCEDCILGGRWDEMGWEEGRVEGS